ncbi:hypothetical protein ACFFTP_31105, partial [Streptomyces roseoviridis]
PTSSLPKATPIFVTGVDKTHVHLQTEGNDVSLTRGEVRTFKDYERRLGARRSDVQQIAEEMRSLSQVAIERSDEADSLYLMAQRVEGGAKLIGRLARLKEAALEQRVKADSTYWQAVRSVDDASAVLANVATRYGGIYQAVVDSDETAPAELRFYKD